MSSVKHILEHHANANRIYGEREMWVQGERRTMSVAKQNKKQQTREKEQIKFRNENIWLKRRRTENEEQQIFAQKKRERKKKQK